jgi:tetratricopeptide (TPR) repeat protein
MKPADVASTSDLAACLDELRRFAGWTYSKIDSQRKRHPRSELLPRSTVNDLCTGKTQPTREKVVAFLRMCRLPEDAAKPYLQAWERVHDNHFGRPRPARRVRDWDPLLLGVHRPIQVQDAQGDLPTYVQRDVDNQVRTLIRRGAVSGGCFLLLVGDSSVGKTRSAFEALAAEVPHWWFLHPTSSTDIEALAADSDRNTVVWLDEIQRILSDGLTAGTVRVLLTTDHPVLLVGTMWPGPYQQLTTLPADDRTHDPYGRHREVLRLATVVRLSETLSPEELDRAGVAAATDSRLAAALASRYGVIRALAAVPALLRRWEGVPNALCRVIITAAVDAVRLGVQAPLSAELLRDAVVDDLTPAERANAVPEAWDAALTYTTRELDGAASVLEPVGTSLGVTDGYRVADFLVEYIGRARTAIVPPASAWESYCSHVSAGTDMYTLGYAAEQRMLLRYAEHLYRNCGTVEGWLALGYLLFRQHRPDEALAAWREALALDMDHLDDLVDELDSMGWPDIAESILRAAVDLGELDACHGLANRLDERGRAEEADRLWHEAVDADLAWCA